MNRCWCWRVRSGMSCWLVCLSYLARFCVRLTIWSGNLFLTTPVFVLACNLWWRRTVTIWTTSTTGSICDDNNLIRLRWLSDWIVCWLLVVFEGLVINITDMHNYNVANRFTTKTKLRNWYEEKERDDHDSKEYLYQKEKNNNLTLNTTAKLGFSNQQVWCRWLRWPWVKNKANGPWRLGIIFSCLVPALRAYWHLISTNLFWARRHMQWQLRGKFSLFWEMCWLWSMWGIMFQSVLDMGIRSDWLLKRVIER